MKTKKIIYGLSILMVTIVTTLNVKNSLGVSTELGYASLGDLLSINSASAEEGAGICGGPNCDSANGNHYGLHVAGNQVSCCGVSTSTPGEKQASGA